MRNTRRGWRSTRIVRRRVYPNRQTHRQRRSMRPQPLKIARLSSLIAVTGVLAWGQALPLEPLHEAGASVTGAFEGWFKNPDGTFSLLLGYYNRNLKQELDIPIGPNNQIEPGGPDRGQPTHFLPGRQTGVFVITVPKEFTAQQRLTWTITL